MNLPSFLGCLGMLTAWGLGYFLNWRVTAYVLVIPPILLTLFAFVLPETPYWLIENQKIEEAKKSLQFIRGAKYDIADELSEIIRGNQAKSEKSDKVSSFKTGIKRMCSFAFLKPFSCVGLLFIITMGSGLDALLVHMVDVLEGTESKINPSIGPIIVGSIRLVFAGVIPFVIRRFVPKIMFITCQALSTLFMVLLAVYVYLQNNHPDKPYLDFFDWMPLTVVILCSILRSIGIAPVLSILLR